MSPGAVSTIGSHRTHPLQTDCHHARYHVFFYPLRRTAIPSTQILQPMRKYALVQQYSRSALRLWTVNMRCEADVWCPRGRTGLMRRRARAHSKQSTTCYLRLFQQQTTLSNGAGGDALTSSTLPQMASMSGHIYPDVSHTTRQRNTVR